MPQRANVTPRRQYLALPFGERHKCAVFINFKLSSWGWRRPCEGRANRFSGNSKVGRLVAWRRTRKLPTQTFRAAHLGEVGIGVGRGLDHHVASRCRRRRRRRTRVRQLSPPPSRVTFQSGPIGEHSGVFPVETDADAANNEEAWALRIPTPSLRKHC